MATVSIYLDDRKKSKDGKHYIYFIISHRSRQSFINSNIKIPGSHFDKVKLIKKNCPGIIDHIVTNNQIRKEQINISNYISSIPHIHRLSAKDIKNKYIQHLGNTDHDYFSFFEIVANTKQGRTRDLYLITLGKMKQFNSKTTSISEINTKYLNDFENWMKLQGHSINNISIQMRNIRHVYNYAIDEGIAELNQYPFRKYEIKKERTLKKNLSIDVIRRIRDANISGVAANARDVFMLIFYLIGINLKDLSYLTRSNIYNNRLTYTRFKGGRQYSIKLEPEAINLIEKLSGDKHLIYLLDHYATYDQVRKEINKKLKYVAKAIDMPELPLSTYYARHSWATIAINNGISKDDIRLCLGHAENDVTDIYLAPDEKLKDRANRKLLDLLKA